MVVVVVAGAVAVVVLVRVDGVRTGGGAAAAAAPVAVVGCRWLVVADSRSVRVLKLLRLLFIDAVAALHRLPPPP